MSSRMERLQRLRGMGDVPEGPWLSLRRVQDSLRDFLSIRGYRVLETPILEPTELFLRKSGGELAARLYTFTEPGGNQVSLRPEYTASILRHYLEAEDAPLLPARVQYAGPVFRYDDYSGTRRQFTQVGAELLGSADPRADAEVLSISYRALSQLGLRGHSLEMTDQGVLYRLLESLGLSERAVGFILASTPELKEGRQALDGIRERAERLHILGPGAGPADAGAALGEMEEEHARRLLRAMFQWTELGSLAQRDPSEVVDRLLRKSRGADDPARLERGLEMASRLAAVRGEPATSIREAEELIRSSRLDSSVLEGVKKVIDLMESEGVPPQAVTVDFGLARGLAYYTGIVFEIKHTDQEASLGGGGRYDGLARALGSRTAIPALGFAYTAEVLVEALRGADKEETLSQARVGVLVLASGESSYGEAARVARELRASGKQVEMDVCGAGLEESLAYARARGLAEVIEVDGAGRAKSYPIEEAPPVDGRKGARPIP